MTEASGIGIDLVQVLDVVTKFGLIAAAAHAVPFKLSVGSHIKDIVAFKDRCTSAWLKRTSGASEVSPLEYM